MWSSGAGREKSATRSSRLGKNQKLFNLSEVSVWRWLRLSPGLRQSHGGLKVPAAALELLRWHRNVIHASPLTRLHPHAFTPRRAARSRPGTATL